MQSNTLSMLTLRLMCISIATMLAPLALADRTHRTDATFYLNYLDDTSVKFQNDTKIETHSDVGFGVGFAYHYTSQLSVGVDTTFQSISYDAYYKAEDDAGDITDHIYGSKMDNLSISINADYYFTPNKVAPYVNGRFGWSFIDTNVPDGPPGSVCWWDPWLGYICDYYQPTKSSSEFGYGAGLGLRYEVNRTSFFKIEYSINYLDVSRADSFDMTGIRLEFGAMY